MGLLAFGLSLGAVAVAGAALRRRLLDRARARRLADFRFPPSLSRKVRATYPHLSDNQVWCVLEGLREFFAISRMANGRLVAMPSQVVDVAWHEFILSTRAYQAFCTDVLGRFLHHTPAEAMQGPRQAQEGLKRAWRLSCLREGMNPARASHLPVLFALDAQLGIADGFKYALDCRNAAAAAAMGQGDGGVTYCGADIGCGGGGGCASGCGSEGGSHGCSGDSGGDGGGGDGGCGGGGCGGGD